MKRIEIATKGYTFDFDQAKATGRLIAEKENDFATLVSWCDKDQQKHSPCCLKCEFEGEAGWEVYGRNHEGRLRISFDADRFVFIYS